MSKTLMMGHVISSLLFQPPEPPTPIRLRASSYCSHMEMVWLTTSRKSRIPAILIHRKYATFTVLYSHGNAEDLGMLVDYLLDMSKILHVNILVYDYTGYGFSNRESTRDNTGSSPISPSEEHCYADISAAYEYLVKVRRIEPGRIILYGRSVGSGPSCYLAQKLNKKKASSMFPFLGCDPLGSRVTSGCDAFRSGAISGPSESQLSYSCSETLEDENESTFDTEYIAGIILHSPFTSIYRIVVDLGFTVQGDLFYNIDRMKDFLSPTLIIHGSRDEIVPFAHGKALHAALPSSCKSYDPFWAQGLGHNNIEVDATNAFVRNLMEYMQFTRRRQRQGNDPRLRGPPSPISHKASLSKQYVQAHVMSMMDDERKLYTDGFLAREKRRTHSSGKFRLSGVRQQVLWVSQTDMELSQSEEEVVVVPPRKGIDAHLATTTHRIPAAAPHAIEGRSPPIDAFQRV